jgi:teichuronic acid biosynthesis glycosyltransferase TuaC
MMLYLASRNVIQHIIDNGYHFDLIDAHYFYPDGVAAMMLGNYFNKPVVITARGTDISFIPQFPFPRRMIRWAAQHANASIAVCEALRRALIDVGAEASRTLTLRNGVDLDLFHPIDREAQRRKLGLTGFTLLSVGNLVSFKGHDLIIEALTQLPETKLIIAGSGPERISLETLAKMLGVSDRVTFVGILPQADLRDYYNAADLLVLASSREGWANVLLESMACGTPVVASNVWGTPEVVASPEAGMLMSERTAKGVAEAVMALRSAHPAREATRKYAEKFSWRDTTEGQIELFNDILTKQ